MYTERDKLIKAKEILLKMANGINPVNGENISKDSFLHDPRLIRCLFYISQIIDKNINGRIDAPKPEKFIITSEEKSKVEFPAYNIGMNEFAKSINNVLNLYESKRITGLEVNKRLRAMGILSGKITEKGSIHTITNDKSKDYGFEMVRASYNGREYDKIVVNDIGKKYLLDNIEKIMAVELRENV